MTFLFSPPTAPVTSSPFDWWPFDDFVTSLSLKPFFTSNSLSQLPTTTTSFTSSSSSSSSSSPSSSHIPTTSPSLSIVDITALPPAATNVPRPRTRTEQNLKPFYLAPVFGLAGLLPGVLLGWLLFRSYERWAAKSSTFALVPGPAYVPVNEAGRTGGDGGEAVGNVEGSPSKHTRHGTAYSSYSVGRGLLGRIPSRLYAPLPMVTQQRTKTTSSEESFGWPSLPGSSRPTPSHSRSTTTSSTNSMQTATMIPDDPFMSTPNRSTGMDTVSRGVVPVSRTSTRSTFADASRFGEMWSGDEEDQDSVVATNTAEGEGEAKTGLLKKIKSKSKFAKRKKQDEKSTSGTGDSAPTVKGASPGKRSWNFPWTSPAKPDSYTVVPTRASSPRSQSFRTPESSPRKPSHARLSEKVRSVDTSVLPASPPTLTSPRLESEFFLGSMAFDVPGTPTPKRTRPSRLATSLIRDEERDDTLPVVTTPRSPSRLNEFEPSYEIRTPTKRDSRPGPSRGLSTASMSTISEFPGDPPRKRTPAERFYARHSALDKVEEIVQRSRSQTSVVGASVGAVEEDRRFGHAGREFESGGIEQRLFEP
jgi:hypothetical protein